MTLLELTEPAVVELFRVLGTRSVEEQSVLLSFTTMTTWLLFHKEAFILSSHSKVQEDKLRSFPLLAGKIINQISL